MSIFPPNRRKAYFIEFERLRSCGRIPLYSSEVSSTLTLIDDVNAESSLIVFVSHRGVSCEQGESSAALSRPLPDTCGNDKFHLLIEAVEKVMTDMTSGFTECYLWIDCVCRDPSDPGLIPYEEIFEVVDITLTPMFDPSVGDVTLNDYIYEARPWGYGPDGYINRSWCRLEMLFSTAIAPRENNETRKAKLSETFVHIFDRNYRPHLLYGSFESTQQRLPLILPEKDDNFFDSYSPLVGSLSVTDDAVHIKKLMEGLKTRLISEQIIMVYMQALFYMYPLSLENTTDPVSTGRKGRPSRKMADMF